MRKRRRTSGPLPQRALRLRNRPVITIHSTDNVTRGKIGSFVLDAPLDPCLTQLGGRYVNFKVSGTAIAGVDYVLLVSPTRIGQSGYGVIRSKRCLTKGPHPSVRPIAL